MRLVPLAIMALTGCSPVQYVPYPALVPYPMADQAALAAEIRPNS